MKSKWRDRVGDMALILVFLAILAASGYAIVKIMTRWTVTGLGY